MSQSVKWISPSRFDRRLHINIRGRAKSRLFGRSRGFEPVGHAHSRTSSVSGIDVSSRSGSAIRFANRSVVSVEGPPAHRAARALFDRLPRTCAQCVRGCLALDAVAEGTLPSDGEPGVSGVTLGPYLRLCFTHASTSASSIRTLINAKWRFQPVSRIVFSVTYRAVEGCTNTSPSAPPI
jgi:hypothetical protein